MRATKLLNINFQYVPRNRIKAPLTRSRTPQTCDRTSVNQNPRAKCKRECQRHQCSANSCKLKPEHCQYSQPKLEHARWSTAE
jgi:hypothetical protein